MDPKAQASNAVSNYITDSQYHYLGALLQLGWSSIACWSVVSSTDGRSIILNRATTRILVYLPQIIENYQLQSGEGLSILFVVIWLIGDITHLVGAIIADLLPIVNIVAAYVSPISDIRVSRCHSACGARWIVDHAWLTHSRHEHFFCCSSVVLATPRGLHLQSYRWSWLIPAAA